MLKVLKKLRKKLNPKKLLKFWRKNEKSILYLVLGVLLLILSFDHFIGVGILSFKRAPESANITNRKSIPVKISIPSLKVDLPIEESIINNGEWQVSNSGASHLNNSARPGEGGNVVIYGHNKKAILGSLPWIKIGSKIIITNANGIIFEYEVTSKTTVSPDKVELLYPTDHEELTIYTCTGLFDSQRIVIKAKLLTSSY